MGPKTDCFICWDSFLKSYCVKSVDLEKFKEHLHFKGTTGPILFKNITASEITHLGIKNIDY